MRYVWMLLALVLLPGIAAFDTPQDAIEEYYRAFWYEEMDAYLGTQYLEHLTSEELANKQGTIAALWEQFDAMHWLEEIDVAYDSTYALATYDLRAEIIDMKSEDLDVFEYEQTFIATLVRTENGWRILQVTPAAAYDLSLSARYFEAPTTTAHPDEETPPEAEGEPEEEPPVCDVDYEELLEDEGWHTDSGFVRTLIGEGSVVKAELDGETTIYYGFFDGALTPTSATEEYDVLVTTDGCTLERILLGADPQAEYDAGNIKIKGRGLVTGGKIIIGKIVAWFMSFGKEPFTKWIEAETADVTGFGRYSFIGPSGRGPGELYLGEGGASGTYMFEADYDGPAHLYLRTSDDAKHPDGSRAVDFVLNGKTYPYNHVSRNTLTADSPWGWEELGMVDVTDGENTLTVTKRATTSAAFAMDKFVLSEEPLSLTEP